MPVSAGGWDVPAGPGGHLQKALQARGGSVAAGPGKRASHSRCLDPASSDGSEAAEGLPGSWRYWQTRKYLALLSLFTAILALLPGLSSAPSSGQLQRGRSTEH